MMLGRCSLQTAVCTASADLSLCADMGQAKLAASFDMDPTVKHKQLVKASRQDPLQKKSASRDTERYSI